MMRMRTECLTCASNEEIVTQVTHFESHFESHQALTQLEHFEIFDAQRLIDYFISL